MRFSRQVVDTFADARDRDILNLAEEMEQDMQADKRLQVASISRVAHVKKGNPSVSFFASNNVGADMGVEVSRVSL